MCKLSRLLCYRATLYEIGMTFTHKNGAERRQDLLVFVVSMVMNLQEERIQTGLRARPAETTSKNWPSQTDYLYSDMRKEIFSISLFDFVPALRQNKKSKRALSQTNGQEYSSQQFLRNTLLKTTIQ